MYVKTLPFFALAVFLNLVSIVLACDYSPLAYADKLRIAFVFFGTGLHIVAIYIQAQHETLVRVAMTYRYTNDYCTPRYA